MEEAVARAEFMELAKNLHRKYILKIIYENLNKNSYYIIISSNNI